MKMRILAVMIFPGAFLAAGDSLIQVKPRKDTPASRTEIGASLGLRVLELAVPSDVEEIESSPLRNPVEKHVKKIERSNPHGLAELTQALEESDRSVARVHICRAVESARQEVAVNVSTQKAELLLAHKVRTAQLHKCFRYSIYAALAGFETAIVVAVVNS